MEYIFERKPLKEWQKHLNQWKHSFEIQILKIVHHNDAYSTDSDMCTIYLIRKPK
jgi:hypothetical protein